MKKQLRKFIVFALAIVLIFACFCPDTKDTYAGTSNGYLVLVQLKNGSWKEYKKIIEESGSGNLMIRAKTISKALGLSYKNYKESFVVEKSASRYNSYIINKKEFTYTNGTVKTEIISPEAAYTSEASSYKLCQVSTLGSLVHYKYFSSSYCVNGTNYKGFICYSRYKNIPDTVPEATPEPTKKPTLVPQNEPTMVVVEGVEFPVRENFLPANQALSDWGGTADIWSELEREVDGKIIEATDLIISNDMIEFTHLVAGSDGVYLKKVGKGYKISISVKLSGSILTEQNASILKAMIATISSKPSLVYTAIYDSFTSDKTHGLNEKKYVTIGDCNIKVEIKSGVVSFLIKESP